VEVKEMSEYRVLVTGGAGFIGSNTCEYLLEQGIAVVCIDNLLTGHESNIAHLKSNEKFKFINGDIRDIKILKSAISGCTHVCHQAALGSVSRSIEDPVSTNNHNVNGTLNVFWAAYQEGIKRVVYASSSSVYGDEKSLPKMEQHVGIPLSPYAVSKIISEQYAKVFTDLYGMEMIGLRYFNVFGRRQDPEGVYAAVIPKFINNLVNHEPSQIFGDGEQSRDFTYIDNVIQANANAMFDAKADAYGKVFNIAFGDCISVNNLFFLIRDLLTEFDPGVANVKVNHVAERDGEIRHSIAEISAAREYLGYDPIYDFQMGMKNTISWYWNSLR